METLKESFSKPIHFLNEPIHKVENINEYRLKPSTPVNETLDLKRIKWIIIRKRGFKIEFWNGHVWVTKREDAKSFTHEETDNLINVSLWGEINGRNYEYLGSIPMETKNWKEYRNLANQNADVLTAKNMDFLMKRYNIN